MHLQIVAPQRLHGMLAAQRKLLFPAAVLLCLIVPARVSSAVPLPAPAPLTRIDQIHRLPLAEASKHLPVAVSGVVTAFSGRLDFFFLEDATGGIAIDREEHTPVQPGDAIVLTGVTEPGLFATSIISTEIRVVGHAPMPPAHLTTYAELEGGGMDSQWIAVRGVVRSARAQNIWDSQRLVLTVEIGGGLVAVRIARFNPGDAQRLVDAVVEIPGVCGTIFNDRRQFNGIRLFVDDVRDVHVLTPAPPDPYAIPSSAIPSVLQFVPGQHERHRVKVTGTVTYQDPGRSLYIQDGSDGILLSTDQSTLVPLGTRIEAIGFPALGAYAPNLENGEFRILGFGRPIAPVAIRASDFLRHHEIFTYAPYEGQLVHLQARLVSPLSVPSEQAWIMTESGGDFVVSLRRDPASAPLTLEEGSIMSVTGIFSVVADENHEPRAFRVLLRTPEDLVVVRKPSWWTTRHLMIVLSFVLTAAFATTLWGILLRRRVHQQTRMLRESEQRFRLQAQHDALTGLASRSFLHERLHEAILHARRENGRIGLLMVDLDHFKQVNDTLGHHAGDDLLRVVAERIRVSVRKGDLVARMGGDEFIVLLTNIGDPAEAELIGAKVVSNVSAPAEIAHQPILVSASVGVCTFPEAGGDGISLLQNVDAAMYKAKAAGRNSFSVYTPSEYGSNLTIEAHA